MAVRAFVKTEGQTLRILVRVPFEAMRDLELTLSPEGYIHFDGVEPELRKAAQVWIASYLELYEDGRRLPIGTLQAARLALPSDASFATYDGALAGFRAAPLTAETQLHWQHALLDVLLEYPITSAAADFTIRPTLAHLGQQTTTVLLFLPPGGAERVYQYVGDPGTVRLDPRWYHAALSFTKLGFLHILAGLDHLLFVLCLVIPFRRIRPLIGIVTSFTVAHSITLGASALGYAPTALWFPPLVEVIIALSIVLMALENIVGPKLERRWVIAFVFGLVHGFGFAFALRESLQFAGTHLVTSLLAFNIGVELGQILVLLAAVPLLGLLFRYVVAERMGIIVLSAFVTHTAWHWLADRVTTLRAYRFTWPAFDVLFLAAAMRALMIALIAAGAMWLSYQLVQKLGARREQGSAEV
ncbi:MAG TPA: HupE/UreJ family protein [Longimicrobiales bacterium]|nr:HupE/UreJ family protein [Longimicrobiales bacterium]